MNIQTKLSLNVKEKIWMRIRNNLDKILHNSQNSRWLDNHGNLSWTITKWGLGQPDYSQNSIEGKRFVSSPPLFYQTDTNNSRMFHNASLEQFTEMLSLPQEKWPTTP